MRRSALISLAAVSLVLGGADTALGNGGGGGEAGGTEHIHYRVIGLDYDAQGLITGGDFGAASCNAGVDSLWEGTVTTTSSTDVTALDLGKGQLKIGERGTRGSIEATLPVGSTLSDSLYRRTLACSEDGTETDAEMFSCGSPEALASDQTVKVSISGGLGDRLRLDWTLSEDPDGFMVPDQFSCREPFTFPEGDCDPTQSKIHVFNHRKVSFHFTCFGDTTVPPQSGPGYSRYESTASAAGQITLKRKPK